MTEATQTIEAIEYETGSFRDRSARVFYRDNTVYRYLNETALKNWELVSQTPFFTQALQRGTIIESSLDNTFSPHSTKTSETDLFQWAGLLQHRLIPFISYPYEWPFGMLKDAALLHLDLLKQALEAGFILKDSSAFNIQWQGSKPIFIDIPSIEPYNGHEPWVGYQQFCEMFLAPLLLNSYKNIPFQEWLIGNPDGIKLQHLAAMAGLRDWLRPGMFRHVILHSRLQAQFSDTKKQYKAELANSGFGKELILNNVADLQKIVRNLQLKDFRSEWSDYAQQNTYTEADQKTKEAFIERHLQQNKSRLVWDIGCNTGHYSYLAAKHCEYVVAIDGDTMAIEKLYRKLKQENNTQILPLIVNLTHPSPNVGWRCLERKTLWERTKPDMVLCLALIHHLVFGQNILVSSVLQWLAELAPTVVLEYVSTQDPMSQKLLLNKEQIYRDYDEEAFKAQVLEVFDIVEAQALPSGTRTLYCLKRKAL